MKLPELQKRGILESPSWRRWLANGELSPVIEPSGGTVYDFSRRQIALMRLFEILADLTDLETARNGIILARQKRGVGSPVPLTLQPHPAVTIQIDLVMIESEVARRGC